MKVTPTPNPSSEPGLQVASHGPTSGPRRQALSHGPEADALLDEVRAAVGTLSKLLSHGELGAAVTLAIRGALDEVSAKLHRDELRVVVVGEDRSGKSTFLDALLGERLLGLAKTPPNTVTTIRSKAELGYRARLTDGFIDDFALRVPDETDKRMAELETAEARLADAKRQNVAAAVEVAAAADALERVETAMTDAFRAFETAREDAQSWSGKLDEVQQTWGRLCADATERANALPALFRRRQPPWWAIWLWVARFVALVLYWPSWQRHHAVLLASGKAETEVDTLRAESSRAAERCWQAEAKLGAANIPVEQARQALESSRRIEHEAEAACQTLSQEVNERRREVQREQSDRKRHFVADVRALTNMEDRGKDVIDLEIDYPASLLPDDIALIETPGVTSDDVASSERAWRAIRERADACILVSELEHAVSGETQRFVQPLREAVPHAILLLTKMDETLTDATRKGDGDPQEQVERARRIGTRRFAREMGRDPATVLSVTVAAEETLRGGPASEPHRQRFEADVATLFTLLRYERALILGASSAGIVRRCIGGLTEAKAHAALSHQDRIKTLEAQRIPAPDQFYAEQMKSVDGAIVDAAKGVVASAALSLRQNADLVRTECRTKIAACTTKHDLSALAPGLAETTVKGLTAARDQATSHLEAEADRVAQDTERGVLQALRERYYILHQITRPPDLRAVIDLPLAEPHAPRELAPKLDLAMRSFDRFRVGFGLGGAALGAGVGTLILPGLGSVAGALVGGLATFAKTLGALKQDFTAASDESIAALERAIAAQIEGAAPSVADAVRASLGKSLEHALARFAPFIDEPIEEERAAIASAREKLHDLEALHRRLQEHDARLAALIKTATDASVGLGG